jgi:hypothetical protein
MANSFSANLSIIERRGFYQIGQMEIKEMKMASLDEFIAILSDPTMPEKLSQAKVNRTCKICGNHADFFRDAAAQFEYEVSAICQECQDRYLSY